MTSPALPHFVVLGEGLTDFILETNDRWHARPGGACWNVARVAARLGTPTGWGGAVSQDLFGDALREGAVAAGLDARFIQQINHPPLLAMVPSTTPPDYFFIGADSADLYFDPSKLPSGWLAAAQILCLGCISLAREPLARHLIALAKEAAAVGKTIAFDPNVRSLMNTPSYTATFQTLASLARYIKVSDEDLSLLFPGQDTVAAFNALRALAPQADLLLTQGSAGMTLFTPGGQVYPQPAYPVTVEDTIGCGDATMGAWMSSLLAHPTAPPETHLRQAAATAAIVAQHAGAYAPSAEELTAFMAQT